MAGKQKPRKAPKRDTEKRSYLGVVEILILLVLAAFFLATVEMNRPKVTGDKLRVDSFVDLAERGKLQSALVLDFDSYVVGRYLGDDQISHVYNTQFLKAGQGRLVDILLENRVATTVDQQNKKRLLNIIGTVIPFLMFISVIGYSILSSRRGTGLFKVKSGARKIMPEPGGVSFADVAGQEAAIRDLREIKDYLTDPTKFANLGAQIPKGVLLHGPPGCGKTLLARAFASEAGANFFTISGSDFVELYVGVGAARVRDLFKVARANAPAVIFIDEIDSIGRSRSPNAGSNGSNDEQTHALNAILTEMDGFTPTDGVLVIGATNRSDILDPALLRPGRFDRSVNVERPDERGRLEILTIHARTKRLGPQIDLAAVATKAVGFTGADLASLLNEAALLAVRAMRYEITQPDLEEALQRILEAPERQRRSSLRDKSVGKRYSEDQKVTFADVAGQDNAVAELREITDYLIEPERYADLGAAVPRGVLLFGPPGCGKTLLARALAGEANAAFLSVSASEFVQLYVGQGAARVRDLFAEANSMSPCILFIDELDAIGHARGSEASGHEVHGEQSQSLNQILTELDGFSATSGVIVLAATNRPDVLDPALLRPGRFDRSVALERPDEQGRLAILKIHAKNMRLGPDADLASVASLAIGFTGADLAALLNDAGLLTVRAGRKEISQVELDQAMKRILEAPDHQRRLSQRGDKSIGRRYSERDKITFADVAGQDEAVAELREIKDFLAEPQRFAALGAAVPRGVLLFGPPGCGKTLMARALAGEANAAFLSVSASEFVEVYVGKGAARVRDLFAEARQMAPAILFIDELDSLGRARGGTAGDRQDVHGEQAQALNQILTELDGFAATSGVIVLAATNRPDVLDKALLRPGRFDRSIGLEAPDEDGRLAILEVHAREKVLGPDVDLRAVARQAYGMVGADLANLINEAALLAARTGAGVVAHQHLLDAHQRILEAPERQRRLSMRPSSVGKRYTGADRKTFADVAGCDDAILELNDIRDYLADPKRFAKLGAKPPRGILLSGSPGCGKTLLARAVAGEANAAFLFASGSEFVEVYVGEGGARVRDLFAEARAQAPAILFIDEIDALGSARSSGQTSHAERDQTLNQLLIEMDGFDTRSTVIVMAATNRPDLLDRALLRPGRFDRRVEIVRPDRAGRRAILQLHAADKPLAPNVDLNALAGLTQGLSGADLANVLNEAALLASRSGADQITMEVLHHAVDRAGLGINSRAHRMSEKEKRVVAYHEAGHALVARHAEGATPPYRLTILPRGGALGSCTMLDDEDDRTVVSRSVLMAELAVCLGGWAAEKLIFGEPGSGSGSDLRRMNRVANQMVCELGMSEEFGPLTTERSELDGMLGRQSDQIMQAVRRLADEATRMAVAALEAQRELLDRVANALLERETLSWVDIEELIGIAPGRPQRVPTTLA